MATLLLMTPTVFFSIQRIFDFGDRVYVDARQRTLWPKLKQKYRDLRAGAKLEMKRFAWWRQ